MKSLKTNIDSRRLRLWHYSFCHRRRNESSWSHELQQQGPDKAKCTFKIISLNISSPIIKIINT